MKRLNKGPNYGTQRVSRLRSSTGIYGKRVGGTAPPNAVRAGRR